jgi:periplasmic protein TonB
MNIIHEWAKASTLEVNFAHRNKAYGAYDLRTRYRRHALSAMLIASFLFLCGFGAYFAAQGKSEAMPELPHEVILTTIDPTPPLPPPDVDKPVPPVVDKVIPPKRITFLVPEIVKDNVVKEELPTVADLQDAVSSTIYQVGANTHQVAAVDVAPQTVEAPVVVTVPPPPPPPTTIVDDVVEEPPFFDVVEQMPEIVGGIAGLQAKIVYPEMAKRAGIQGRVAVQFVVDELGNVTQVNVLTPIGGGCDEEAMRVIQQANFRPGMQRGRPVKVRMVVPIRFRLN